MNLKVLVVGNCGVGKTNLLCVYSGRSQSYTATIGVDSIVRHVTLRGRSYTVSFWDTAGQERFRAITRAFYRGAHVVLYVYDVSNQSSYDAIGGWMQDVDTGVPQFIIGNKTDLNAVVSAEQVRYDYPCIPHFQCSCRKPGSVESMLQRILERSTESIGVPSPPPTKTKIKDECCVLL